MGKVKGNMTVLADIEQILMFVVARAQKSGLPD